jgi:hypothetical protein
MAKDEPIRINVTVPLDYHRPFQEVVKQVKSLGMEVQAAHTAVQAIQGTGNLDTLQKLADIPGIFVSRDDHEVTWRV